MTPSTNRSCLLSSSLSAMSISSVPTCVASQPTRRPRTQPATRLCPPGLQLWNNDLGDVALTAEAVLDVASDAVRTGHADDDVVVHGCGLTTVVPASVAPGRAWASECERVRASGRACACVCVRACVPARRGARRPRDRARRRRRPQWRSAARGGDGGSGGGGGNSGCRAAPDGWPEPAMPTRAGAAVGADTRSSATATATTVRAGA